MAGGPSLLSAKGFYYSLAGLGAFVICFFFLSYKEPSNPSETGKQVLKKFSEDAGLWKKAIVQKSRNDGDTPSILAKPGVVSIYQLGAEIDLKSIASAHPLSPEEKEVAETLPTTSVYRRFPLGGFDRTALHNLRQGDVISLPLPGGLECRVVVNLVQSNPGQPFGIAGNLIAGMQGTFSLVEDPLVGTRGFIIPELKEVAFIIFEENQALFLDEVPKGAVICHGMPKAPVQTPRLVAAVNPPVPQLDSRPDAAGTLYLDFDGETVTDLWNGGNTIVAEPPVFSNPDSVVRVWREVVEDFTPFNVNVTTILARYSAAPPGKRMRIIVTPTSSWIPGAGGVAYLNSFQWAGTTPCWAFNGSGNLDVPFNSRMCAMTISHELGHTFGLKHDGLLPATPDDGVGSNAKEPYYIGHSTPLGMWGPIMGAPFDAPIVQWSKNEYRGLHFTDPSDPNFYQGNNPEDDVGIIAGPANKVGFVSDDFSNTLEGCAEIPQGPPGVILLANGLIHSDADVDVFRISLEQGALLIQASNAPVSPNLKLQLTLINPDRVTTNVIANPTGSMVASISNNLPSGTYFLRVEGVGTTTNTNTSNGFVGYGSSGQYQLRGSFRSLPHPPGDFFAEPIMLPSSPTFTISNSILGAVAEPFERGFVTGTARTTIWFRWVAPGTGIMNLNTTGSGFDTVLAVCTGSTLRNLTLLAKNNNAGIGLSTSALRFPAKAGTAYYFVVDSFAGNLGNGQIILNGAGSLVGSVVPNDRFANAQPLGSSTSFSFNGTVQGATPEAGEQALAGIKPTRSVWFQWVPPATGLLELSLTNTQFPHAIGAYTGSQLVSLKPVAQKNFPATGTKTNLLEVPVFKETVYSLKLDGPISTNSLYYVKGNLRHVPAPVSLTFTNLSTSNRQVSPQIAWTAVTGASHYQVEIWMSNRLIRGTSVRFPATNWNNGPALQRLNAYTARIRAFSNTLASDWTTAPVSP